VDQGQLGLSDAQFWEDLGERDSKIMEDVGETGFLGLGLDGPREVQLSSRADLPLVGVRVSSIRDNVLVNLDMRLVAVVAGLETGEVRAATAFYINDDDRVRQPPPDLSRVPKGRTIKVFAISLDDRIEDLPWKPGTLQAHILLYEQRSNPVTVRLVGDTVQDPVVREFLATQRRPAYPPPIWPPLPIGRVEKRIYRERPDSPPVPAAAGIALALERVVVKRPRATCLLRGSYALPVSESEVVRPEPPPVLAPDPGEPPPPSGWVDVGDPEATAVLPITLLFTGDTVADPILVPLRVPAYGAVPPGADGALVAGHFAVDLFAILGDRLEAQSYAVWAISRSVISQPALLGVVTEDMLPPPG
jgi:hypothetical protein